MQILQRVHEAVRERDPSVLARGERWRPGGILELQDHLLHVIDRARHARPERARGAASLCAGCFYLTPTGFCPHRSRCVLHRHADTVTRVIAAATGED